MPHDISEFSCDECGKTATNAARDLRKEMKPGSTTETHFVYDGPWKFGCDDHKASPVETDNLNERIMDRMDRSRRSLS